MSSRRVSVLFAVALASCAVSCSKHSSSVSASSPRTLTVAQSGTADVVGADSAALQRAVNMLHRGDTLSVGAGTYQMDNSLFVPSGVTIKGVHGQTILKKSAGVESPLTEDGDFGESTLAVADPDKFRPGMGVSVVDDTFNSGWDISVTTVAKVQKPYVVVHPLTLRDYDQEHKHARLRNTFPVVSVLNAENVVLQDLIVDGNREANAYMDGCRGGAIYMYCVRNVTVRDCTARNYNGDGISFQISDGGQVLKRESYGHAGFGIHPGTGSAHSLVSGCHMHNNGDIGLFLCWRVRHGRFENNVIEDNGHYGISIGHKDTDNEFTNNTIARNGRVGVYFRTETAKNSGNRNTFRSNKILDNGNGKEGYGFYVEAPTTDIVIENNQIADTRTSGRTQRVAIFKAPGVGTVRAANNITPDHSDAVYQKTASNQAPRTN
jgi:parallel beta-helix repeat protein